jgi:excisionase family DNA binding protein
MPDEPAHPPILTVAEVARSLRVSEATVSRWCSSGKLPTFRVGRGWRVRRGDLNMLIYSSSSSNQHEDSLELKPMKEGSGYVGSSSGRL